MQCVSFSIIAITACAATGMVPAAAFAKIDISGSAQQKRRGSRARSGGGVFSSTKDISASSYGWGGEIARLEARR
jgi:hypothetical protein